MHVRTPISYIGNGWMDCAETCYLARAPLAMYFAQDGDVRTSACVTAHTFKHIYSLPLVYRPKGVLRVTEKTARDASCARGTSSVPESSHRFSFPENFVKFHFHVLTFCMENPWQKHHMVIMVGIGIWRAPARALSIFHRIGVPPEPRRGM